MYAHVDGIFRDEFVVPEAVIDGNGHVNNVRYIEWVLNHLPLVFHRTHVLTALEVNYLAEAVYGHAVSIASAEAGPHHYVHTIRAGDRELFRARSFWKEGGAES